MESDEHLDDLFRDARRRIRLVDISLGAFLVLLFTFSFFFGEIVLDHLLILRRPVRMALLGIYQAGALVLIVWAIGLPLFRRINRLYIAQRLERQYPELKNRLITYLQLGEDVPDIIRNDVGSNLSRKLEGLEVSDTFNFRPLRPFAAGFIGLSLVIYGYALLSPKSVTVSLKRAIQPTQEILPPTQTRIVRVEPGHVDIVRGDPLRIWARTEGKVPEEAEAVYSADGERWERVPLAISERGVLEGKIDQIERTFVYYLLAGDTRSERFDAIAVDPPIVTAIGAKLEHPEFTGLEPRSVQGGTLKAIAGSVAHV